MSAHTSHLSGKDTDGSQIFPVEKEMPKQGETTVRRYEPTNRRHVRIYNPWSGLRQKDLSTFCFMWVYLADKFARTFISS